MCLDGFTHDNTGIYYLDDYGDLYYQIDQAPYRDLCNVNIVNESTRSLGVYTRQGSARMNYLYKNIIAYDNRIFLLYGEVRIDGSYKGDSYEYQLCSINQMGSDFQRHICFEYRYRPLKFIINEGKVYVSVEDVDTDTYMMEIYDSDFTLMDRYAITGDPYSFYVENDEVIVPNPSENSSETTVYDSNDIKVTRNVENETIYSTYDHGDVHLEFENKEIYFVNDEYFYVSSDISPQTYERYTLDGELDTSIVISDSIDPFEEEWHDGLHDKDFSKIVNVRGDDVVYGRGRYGYFSCDFDEKACGYLIG